jgi:hypothetical protein
VSSDTVSAALRETLFIEAKGRCGYCHAPEEFIGMALHVEHLVPRVAGGPTVLYNLWLAYVSCNLHKGRQTHAVDPQTGRRVPLFNPRTQRWKRHFRWAEDGTLIVGRAAVGRATVVALQLNNDRLVAARRRWRMAGWEPWAED